MNSENENYKFFDENELQNWTFNEVLFLENRENIIKTYEQNIYEKIDEYVEILFHHLGIEKINLILDNSFNYINDKRFVEFISGYAYNIIIVPMTKDDIHFIDINMRISQDDRCFKFEAAVRKRLEEEIFKRFKKTKNLKVICNLCGEFEDCNSCEHAIPHIKIYKDYIPCYLNTYNFRICNDTKVQCIPYN